MTGVAFVFCRAEDVPLPFGYAGHVGWGFYLPEDGGFYCGSTENPSGSPIVFPGGDNGWWGERVDSLAAMVDAMQLRAYDSYKFEGVADAHPDAALEVAKATALRGYFVATDNCLDHTRDVLTAYGVQNLPSTDEHPFPNSWFAIFDGELRSLIPVEQSV
ncbi:hypothetical protein CCAX7_59500 [Capsulimonas corticalis]|uniref:Uncharacterized protein n=1 Tax=Capsulimonas corticalis TaxID=2219043 RepID=A0A402CZS5_9BACT|nr:hypothetical protein [Capsulimonas corticalis]BDI33899.1 hypothetical protein CCAX7_59500 [Capsulimonas corticalis]